MAGEIIRLGDPTSHGGKVIEGSPVDICHGKPIAYLGHKTYCPQCRGNFPIIEGAPTTTFYGKGVALAGMKTACGAVLIATQLTDIVGCGGGAGSESDNSAIAERRDANRERKTITPTALAESSANDTPRASPDDYDLYFHVFDKCGVALADWPYRIELAKGGFVDGRTDGDGKTKKVASKTVQQATLHLFEPNVTPINPNWDR
jgi:uncharacterized Zn-binding protein involved in type VI secretion